MFAGALLPLVINGLLHENASLTRYLSDIETNYEFHSLIFMAPNHSFLNIFDFKLLKTPIIYLMDGLVMESGDFQGLNNLFIVFSENDELLSPRTIFNHSKSIVRYGKVMVWNVDVEEGSDGNNFQSTFKSFWDNNILQVRFVASTLGMTSSEICGLATWKFGNFLVSELNKDLSATIYIYHIRIGVGF